MLFMVGMSSLLHTARRRPVSAAAVGAIAAAALIACAPVRAPQPSQAPEPSPAPEPSQAETFTTVTPSPTTTTVAPTEPVVETLDAAALGSTWREGCPVPPADLRRITVSFVDFDGQTERGQIVVHRDLVDDVIAIFEDLRRMRYPIERMQTVDVYPNAEDELSMRDNNTSAFNCRPLPSGSWSEHAYGRAIDLNPLLNPFIDSSGDLQPATAGPYLDRTRTDPGILHDGDAAVRAFLDRGWQWGGYWRNPKDYQHFELPA